MVPSEGRGWSSDRDLSGIAARASGSKDSVGDNIRAERELNGLETLETLETA
jgi:hypothetical protein